MDDWWALQETREPSAARYSAAAQVLERNCAESKRKQVLHGRRSAPPHDTPVSLYRLVDEQIEQHR
ncbi:MAG TPA: hypothetical protein VNS31_12825, partial [Ramlibacter sp.]|nr:hypothetical protein [Ramlibacter sp.]